MNFTGIVIGLCTFLIIGMFHPLVIKAEYYLGKQCWWIFLLAGILFAVLSLFIPGEWSVISGVVAFSSFWSIKWVTDHNPQLVLTEFNERTDEED